MAAAIEVRNGYKYYGGKSNPKVVFKNFNMHVTAGSIYVLLGASACGRTTLLSCVVGQRTLNGGEMSVLGMRPGEVPASRLGYMPQEMALIEEMTVEETVLFFGRIYGLTRDKIREQFKILDDLLQLPPARQLIKNCSGGQQRRVSFACALIHDPELLILDEPTVGLDPMLREDIWNFLVGFVKNAKRTVILTTHCIEEARQAHYVGLMRNGVLLAEDTPTNIMLKFYSNSVEEAFLVLCSKQDDTDSSTAAIANHNEHHHIKNHENQIRAVRYSNINVETTEPAVEFVCDVSDDKAISFDELNYGFANRKKICLGIKGRLKALMIKDCLQIFRHPFGIIFMLLFPIILLSCFYVAIGKSPKNLKIGVVNSEVGNHKTCFDTNLHTVLPSNDTCVFNKISCRYIAALDDSVIEQKYFNTTEEAWSAAKRVDVVGFIHFPHNFSASMYQLLENGRYAKDSDILNAEIIVHIDMTDHLIAHFVERKLHDIFRTFIKHILSDCGIPDAVGKELVQFQNPIYGSFDIEYQQYMAPGLVMVISFFLAALMSATVFVTERLDGLWDRTLVAGVSTMEMLLAHLFTQSIVAAIQSFEVIMYIGLVFDTYNKGDTCTLVGLLILTAFGGMIFGLLISIYCKSHTEVNLIATGMLIPMFILCGLMWPLEAMPKLMQDIVKILPFTVPSTAARNIIEKGWSITNGGVYNGFLVMTTWIVFFIALCIVGLRRKA